MRKSGLIFFLLLTIVMLSYPSVASANTVGYVDYEFLFNAHPEYPSKNEDFKAIVAQISASFESEAAALNDESQIQELALTYDEKIALAADELRLYIIGKVNESIAKVAKESNVSVVVPNSVILYGGTDLTDLVVNQMYKGYGISVPSYLRRAE